MGPFQIAMSNKRNFHKIPFHKNKPITEFDFTKTDPTQNSILLKQPSHCFFYSTKACASRFVSLLSQSSSRCCYISTLKFFVICYICIFRIIGCLPSESKLFSKLEEKHKYSMKFPFSFLLHLFTISLCMLLKNINRNDKSLNNITIPDHLLAFCLYGQKLGLTKVNRNRAV